MVPPMHFDIQLMSTGTRLTGIAEIVQTSNCEEMKVSWKRKVSDEEVVKK